MKVLVCDDDSVRAEGWADRVRAVAEVGEVQVRAGVNFAKLIEDLKRRLLGESNGGDQAAVLDQTDVLVIDSDLTPDSSHALDPAERAQLVSEFGGEVAKLARAYTGVGAVAVVNETHKSPTFDLTLTRHIDSIGDVYICDAELDNPALWNPSAQAEFRPWYWPNLSVLSDCLKTSTKSLNLDADLFESLGLSGASSLLLPGQAESLGLGAEVLATLSLGDLADSPRFGVGLARSRATADRARVAVSAAQRWLERVVVPEENILIDLPHLLQRRPWLVDDRGNLERWRELALNWDLDSSQIESGAFNPVASRLVGRPVWNLADLGEPLAGGGVREDDPVFCEDVSDFSPWSEASVFISDLEGSHSRRFVRWIEKLEYSPMVRLMQ